MNAVYRARLRQPSASLPLRARERDGDEVQRDRPLCTKPRYGEVIARISPEMRLPRGDHPPTSADAEVGGGAGTAPRHARARPARRPSEKIAAARTAYANVVRRGAGAVSNASAT